MKLCYDSMTTTLKDHQRIRDLIVPQPILATKLYIPPPRPGLVSRPRLNERLSEGLQSKLILISAPAGFGKSTLLIDWVHQSNMPVAWISLERGDNDWGGFLAYFVAALQTIEAGIGETVQAMIQSPQPPSQESVLTALINEVATLKKDFILVLDDYHVIEARQIHDSLAFLLDHLPPRMHLVISGRSDPFLPLSRMRSKGELTELRAENLRFSAQETTTFLNQVMGLTLSRQEVDALEARTEGWIAGLHLAALSILDRTQSGEDPTGFIAAFAGDDRFIVDYLVDEVLAQLSQETKDFLLQTSILERLSGSLCDAVTGRNGGQKSLERLERANLFITPLDSRRRWYRYHQLFADLLRQRLQESANPEEIEALHMRASRWYEENDFFVEAVEHALAAQEHTHVIRLIYSGSAGIFMRSELKLLLRWQAALPGELLASEPKLSIMLAWAWIATGHPREAESCLQTLEAALGEHMDDLFNEAKIVEPYARSVLVEVAVIRAQLAIGRGDLRQADKLTSQILPFLKEGEGTYIYNTPDDLRTVVFFISGLVKKLNGDLPQADEALSTAADLGKAQGNVHIFAAATAHLANVRTLQGKLRQAVSTSERGLQGLAEMAGRHSPLAGQIHVELGNAHYERNDLDTALYHIEEGIALAKPWDYWEGLVPGYLGLARIRAAQKEWESAWNAMSDLETLSQNYPHLVPAAESARALLSTLEGKADAARSWAEAESAENTQVIDLNRESDLIILARVLAARGNWVEAEALIERLIEIAGSGGRHGRTIELLALQSLVCDALDEPERALDALSHALAFGEPEGYVRTFVDLGTPMIQLLSQAAEQRITPEYAGRLLGAFPQSAVTPTKRTTIPAHPPLPGLVEPLSEREIEILRLIARGLSNKEIAQQLYLSQGTIKVHAHNIYGKLGVNGRTQAIARATDLGILRID